MTFYVTNGQRINQTALACEYSLLIFGKQQLLSVTIMGRGGHYCFTWNKYCQSCLGRWVRLCSKWAVALDNVSLRNLTERVEHTTQKACLISFVRVDPFSFSKRLISWSKASLVSTFPPFFQLCWCIL